MWSSVLNLMQCTGGRSVEGVDEKASMKRPRLRAVQPRSGARLELTFTNGQRYDLDMSDVLAA